MFYISNSSDACLSKGREKGGLFHQYQPCFSAAVPTGTTEAMLTLCQQFPVSGDFRLCWIRSLPNENLEFKGHSPGAEYFNPVFLWVLLIHIFQIEVNKSFFFLKLSFSHTPTLLGIFLSFVWGDSLCVFYSAKFFLFGESHLQDRELKPDVEQKVSTGWSPPQLCISTSFPLYTAPDNRQYQTCSFSNFNLSVGHENAPSGKILTEISMMPLICLGL